MNKAKGYTEADLAEVSDNPEWTDAEIASARPFPEVFPDLAEKIATGDRLKASPKKLISLRLDAEVIERFRATGPGWQSRINDALRKATGLAG